MTGGASPAAPAAPGAGTRVAFLDDSEVERPPRRGLGPLRAMAAAIFPADQLAPFAAALTALRTELGCPGRAQTDCRSRGSPRSLRRPARSGGTCTPDASPALS